jgi:hypothetical protein
MHDKQQDTFSRQQEDTGEWLLEKKEFVDWVGKDESNPTLWCPGNRRRFGSNLHCLDLTLKSGHWQNSYDVSL